MTPIEARPEFVQQAENAWFLLIRAQPGAKKTEPAGIREGRLCIRLHAPAVENKANKELVAFVAKTLGLRPAKVTLTSGDTGRHKRLRIDAENEPDWSALTGKTL